MADEARNVDILKQAYRRWSESKGESGDEWMKICADNIAFGSLAQGSRRRAHYLTAYQAAMRSRTISPGSPATGR